MGEPYIGEVRIVGFDYAPVGWAKCDGQTLSINQNQTLFAQLGVTYGGNGITDFKLPDLRGRVPIHFGDSFGGVYLRGQLGGVPSTNLHEEQMATHSHYIRGCPDTADTALPDQALFASTDDKNVYENIDTGSLVQLPADTVNSTGQGAGHPNTQPTLVLNFIIALRGLWPPRD
ncbi:MAG: phage tail protein [Magnetococcales bacterium]|nr:phage tail protein [Magnetococcales bacterium]